MPITGFVSSCLGIALPSGVIATDPATTAWVNAVIANGGTVSAGRQTLINNLIAGGKADGWWAKLDRLWIFAGENEPSALTDMVALVLAVTNSSPSFTIDRGYTGVDSNTTVYIDTSTNNTNVSKFGTNAGHISAWSNTNTTSSAGGGCICGIESSVNTNETSIFPLYSDGNAYFRINDATASTGIANANSLGHYLANRSGASASQGYINGNLVVSPNAAAGTIPNLTNITVLLLDDFSSGGGAGSACQITMHSLGGNLSGTDVTNFYNRLRTYMTAVGVP
jgi:hypothetical protein